MHGSIFELVDSNGNTTASYGYTRYGQTDSTLSHGENADKTNPINPFRYSGERTDTGSGTLTPDFFYVDMI